MCAKRIIIIILASFFLLPALTLAEKVPGVTDTDVVVGISAPLSGPAALWALNHLGAKAWAEYFNDKDGVHGRKIKVILVDDAYNPMRAMINLQDMKGKVFAVIGLTGSPMLNASKHFFAENKILLIGHNGDPRIFAGLPKEEQRYIFSTFPDTEDEGAYLAEYAIGKLGMKKIAMFYQNDDYGKKGFQGVKNALSRHAGKAELVGAVPYEVTDRAMEPHALTLQKTNADAVVIFATPTHGPLIVKEMAKIPYRPTILTCSALADPMLYKVAGEPWDGVYSAHHGMVSLPEEPAGAKVGEILLKYNPKFEGKLNMPIYGAVWMMHFVEGLKNAGRNLSTESFIRGMEMIKDWKAEGMGGLVTYGPGCHHGINANRMVRCVKGKSLILTDFTNHKPLF